MKQTRANAVESGERICPLLFLDEVRKDDICYESVFREVDEVQISRLDSVGVAFLNEEDVLQVYPAVRRISKFAGAKTGTYRYGIHGFAPARCREARYFLKLPSMDIKSSSSNMAYQYQQYER